MATVIPVGPVTISCIVCLTHMRIEWQEQCDRDDEIIVAAECKCRRLLGRLGYVALRYRQDCKFSSTDLQPLSADDLAEWGRRSMEHGRELMLRGERFVSAATWVRG